MAKVRVPFKIKYVNYYVTDDWRTVICFTTHGEARRAAEIFKKHGFDAVVFKEKVVIPKYVVEWKIYLTLSKGDG